MFSLTEDTDPEFVVIEGRDDEEIDRLIQTLRLVDIVENYDQENRKVLLYKDDAVEWLRFELAHWISKPLGKQFVENDQIREAIALEKLMMNMEK